MTCESTDFPLPQSLITISLDRRFADSQSAVAIPTDVINVLQQRIDSDLTPTPGPSDSVRGVYARPALPAL